MDAPLPLPLADPLVSAIPLAPGAPPAAGTVDVAARFATLLELARLTLEPADASEAAAEAAPDDARETPAEGAQANALDGLLFLSAINAAPTTPVASPASVPESIDDVTRAPRPGAPSLALILPKVADAAADATASAATSPTAPADMPLARNTMRIDARVSTLLDTTHDAAGAKASPAMAANAEPLVVDPVTRPSEPLSVASVRAATDAIAHDATAPVVHATAPHAQASGPHASLSSQTTFAAIETPVSHARFHEDAASHLASLVTRGVERAELRVTPPELGPVEVRIDVSNGEASFAIVATQPATRDALEQALPLLRDLLAAHGLTLGEASVKDGQADAQSNPSQPSPAPHVVDASDAADETPIRSTFAQRRLVDVFA